MPTLLELEQKRDSKRAEARKLHTAASDAGRDFTDAESTSFDTLMNEVDVIQLQATSMRNREERLAKLDSETTASAGRKMSPNPIGTPPSVIVGKDRIEDDPMKGFKGPRDFMTSVMHAAQGRPVAEGLKFLRASRFQPEAEMAAGSDEHGAYSDTYGGYFVPSAISPQFLQLEPEPDPTAILTRKIPMAATTIKMNYRVDKTHTTSVSGGLTVGRSAETVAKTASRMSTGQFDLRAHSLFGFSYATEEILTDSAVSFIALLEAGFRDEFNSHILNERLNGTGVAQFQGVMTSGALISVTRNTADDIKFVDVVNMRSRCWRYAGAVWMANHDTLPKLMQMNVEVGVGGGPVWQPSAREDHPDIVLGRPIFFSEYTKSLGTAGDIVLVNWGEFLEGLYQPLQSAESMHVRFLEHERAFKFWLRNAGSPWWDAALTPKNGSTLSPYVALAA